MFLQHLYGCASQTRLHVIAFCCHLRAGPHICGIIWAVGCSYLCWCCCWSYSFALPKVDKELLCDGVKQKIKIIKIFQSNCWYFMFLLLCPFCDETGCCQPPIQIWLTVHQSACDLRIRSFPTARFLEDCSEVHSKVPKNPLLCMC